MRFNSITLLTGATAVAAGNTANLLLPGFQGRDLQAGVLGSAGDVTTYLVSCPQTVAAAACGIPGNAIMTAVAAPNLMQLTQVDSQSNTALLNCNVAGQTYASCSAQSGTLSVQSTLGSNNLNWMPVTVTGPVSTSTPTPTPSSTVTPTPTATPTSTVTPSSTVTPTSTMNPTSIVTSTSFICPSSFKKSSTPVSSSLKMTSTPLVVPSNTGVTGTPVPTSAPTSTPATGAAASLSGNTWALGGAVLALVYALA